MPDLYIDNVALSGRSAWIEENPNAGDVLAATYTVEVPHLRRGAIAAGIGPYRERRVEVNLAVITSANTVAARRQAEDELKDFLGPGLHTIRLEDDVAPSREIDGYLEQLSFVPTGHPLNAVKSMARAVFFCPEGDWRAPQGVAVSLAVAGTRYALPLGTAPSTPIVRIMGSATDPVFRIRSAAGELMVELTFTTDPTTSDWIDIDCHRGVIELVASGVRSNVIGSVTVGSTLPTMRFPFALDPAWGEYRQSSWPTAEVSAGTAEVLYAKRYR